MGIKWKPMTAGILTICLSAPTLITRIIIHFEVDWIKNITFSFAVVMGIVSIFGGYCALRRKYRGLAFAGVICLMLLWFEEFFFLFAAEFGTGLAFDIFVRLFFIGFPLAILSIVFLALSKKDFT